MVSSTYTDLKEHREALIAAINEHGLHPNVMEYDSARLVDVIDSSFQMVRDSAAYILLISQKYGQTPECPKRNPNRLSITELEFDEAQRLGRPTLLFIMGEDHHVKLRHIEQDPEKRAKLNTFRDRAKKASPSSSVHRVYSVFNSSEEFKNKMNSPLAELDKCLNSSIGDTGKEGTLSPDENVAHDTISTPPAFYAEPDYIGSHQFVGRQAELDALSDWANRADPTNLLLFEAIGGNGKSMLTWEWTTRHASVVRHDWAGRFWYSFYERHATMQDFCQRALAYMTGRPLEGFAKKKTAELAKDFLAQLHAQPWLLILDGLERVLVAYHRIDAAEVPDEEANAPTDKVLKRNPCDVIRDEDNDLLRALAACAPSKILVSSRLTPRILLNQAGQPIPGAKRITLPGLRPPDAEALLRSCGITGDSAAIQDHLRQNCDNHPLVIGVLAGLIANYLPDRGNFDAWSTDPSGGAALDLAKLDLVQRRNHILLAAIAALPDTRHQLLSTLALLSESVDYDTLKAFNPHLPPEPDEVDEPTKPEDDWHWDSKDFVRWDKISEKEKAKARKQYEADLERRRQYEKSLKTWRESAEVCEAPTKLAETVGDLEQRGLLQYDGRERRYDLHPVVRGVAAGGMKAEDKERHGQRVVDHFSSMPHNPYEEAETLEDLRPGLNVVRTLLKLGQFQQAVDAYQGSLSEALFFNLEAHVEILSLLRPFFPTGWGELPKGVNPRDVSSLANDAGIALRFCGEMRESLAAFSPKLRADLEAENWARITFALDEIAKNLADQNLFSKALRVNAIALATATVNEVEENVFVCRLSLFSGQSRIGNWAEAELTWQLLDPMGRDWPRHRYRSGRAEYWYARFQFWKGSMQEEHLAVAERLATEDKNRREIRTLHWLRGAWRMEQGQWALAVSSLQGAVRMARERSLPDAASETGLAFAKLHLGQLGEPHLEAERLAEGRQPAHRLLAKLWFALGDHARAKQHALRAFKEAWADGEPYVHRYELTKITELLQQMNLPIPTLQPYDPAKDEPFPWEADVRAAIEKLRAEKEANEKAEKQRTD